MLAQVAYPLRAHLVERQYEKGVKITDEQMAAIRITQPDRLPKWNYTIGPDA